MAAVMQAMTLLPTFLRRTTQALAQGFLVVGWAACLVAQSPVPVQEAPPAAEDDGAIPRPVNLESFTPLVASSPFTRTLGVSDSLILTGIARVQDEVFATLLDTKTFESQVVSKAPNFQGWQLLSVSGLPDDMQTWSARIQVGGGQVISVRYQKPPAKTGKSKTSGSTSGSGSSSNSGGGGPPLNDSQMKEARQAAENYREGFTGDGFPRQPPPEIVDKLSRLSVGQREDINRQMLGLRNRGLGMDERRRIYVDMVDRASQSRR